MSAQAASRTVVVRLFLASAMLACASRATSNPQPSLPEPGDGGSPRSGSSTDAAAAPLAGDRGDSSSADTYFAMRVASVALLGEANPKLAAAVEKRLLVGRGALARCYAAAPARGEVPVSIELTLRSWGVLAAPTIVSGLGDASRAGVAKCIRDRLDGMIPIEGTKDDVRIRVTLVFGPALDPRATAPVRVRSTFRQGLSEEGARGEHAYAVAELEDALEDLEGKFLECHVTSDSRDRAGTAKFRVAFEAHPSWAGGMGHRVDPLGSTYRDAKLVDCLRGTLRGRQIEHDADAIYEVEIAFEPRQAPPMRGAPSPP